VKTKRVNFFLTVAKLIGKYAFTVTKSVVTDNVLCVVCEYRVRHYDDEQVVDPPGIERGASRRSYT